jgi:hypothetical protein
VKWKAVYTRLLHHAAELLHFLMISCTIQRSRSTSLSSSGHMRPLHFQQYIWHFSHSTPNVSKHVQSSQKMHSEQSSP